MNVKMIVAAHKPYEIPQDSMYFPIQVGASGKPSIGFQRDDENQNISHLNPYFCELTGLYWAWKNLPCDIIGLDHYRRHFKGKQTGEGLDQVLSQKEVEDLLEKVDCIVPKKQMYFIETVESHYAHTHFEEDLQVLRQVIQHKYPEYSAALEQALKRRGAHMFNMFIMKKPLADQYCEFLFGVLEEVHVDLKNEERSPFQARSTGRLGELLLDVFLSHNNISFIELPVLYVEKINWPKKISHFLKAKFLHQKYDSSF